MKNQNQSICLNMIVKNEAHVIRRCLDSLKSIIDRWVIVDTGSTDGTQEMIREHLADVPGELIERPWVNFAHNRSEALEYARGKADYLLVIDADEVLQFDADFVMPDLTQDAYHLEIISGGFSYFKTQLVNNALKWSFKNVVHEYIDSPEAKTNDILRGAKTIRHPDGARSRDPNTYRKDALMLESALLEEPDNARYVFYLAQSYRDASEPELAIKNYRKRIEMGGWIEEVWYSLYQVGEIKQRMEAPWPEVLEAYLTAYRCKPDRAEPLYKIGIYYQWKREFHLAYLFFNQAMAIPYPKHDRLFIEKSTYDYVLPLEYSVCCYYVGEYARSIKINNLLLCSRETPANLINRIIQNRQFSLDALYPKKENSTKQSNKIKVCVPFHNPGPHLDSCVESLLLQDYENFELIFIDDGSNDDYSAKIPLEDERVTLIRHKKRQGWVACLHEALTQYCEPDDIVFPLSGSNWLAEDDALKTINNFFQDYACQVMYGQFHYSSGHAGLAMPLPDEASLRSLREGWHCLTPFIFRCSLFRSLAAVDPEYDCLKDENGEWLTTENAVNYALLEKAGLSASRFNDQVLMVVNLESEDTQAQDISEEEAENLSRQIRHKRLIPA